MMCYLIQEKDKDCILLLLITQWRQSKPFTRTVMHLWKQSVSAEDEILSLGNLFTAPQRPVTVLSSLHQSTLLHFPWKHSCDISAPSIHFTKALCTAETPNFLWVWFSPISGHLHIIRVPLTDGSGWDLWGVDSDSVETEIYLIQLSWRPKMGTMIISGGKNTEKHCINLSDW